MRTTINIEFTDEEIRNHVEDLGRRWIFSALGALGSYIGNLDPQLLMGMQQGMNHVMQSAFQQAVPRRQHGVTGPPPIPGWPPGVSYVGPQPGAGPFGPPPGAGPFGNVRPMREPAAVERCFAIEATRHMEAGIGCCKCATFNGVQRTACRHCGHQLCVIAPPPPAAPEPEPAP